MDEDEHISPQDFGAFAAHELDLWRILEGSEALVEDGRTGPVRPVYVANNQIRVQIRLANLDGSGDVRWYSATDLVRGCEVVGFRLIQGAWDKVKNLASRRDGEAWARGHFRLLRAKYFVGRWTDLSPLSQLYRILLRLEESELPEQKELDWLRDNEVHSVLASSLELRFLAEGGVWNLVEASKLWRRAKHPRQALRATEGVTSSDPDEMAALVTTRGGAYRDLGDLAEAEELAQSGIKRTPDRFQGYNLLGAVRYEQGRAEEGDRLFEKAITLGARPELQEQSKVRALRRAGPEEQRSVAVYLLDKDPELYAWARTYLAEQEPAPSSRP
ncbi:MAG: tetratricopeptide repeat protein [Chloroflexi bacterium]|nr:tetratricopeptide repeat protein [Chloroflexota bacterium]